LTRGIFRSGRPLPFHPGAGDAAQVRGDAAPGRGGLGTDSTMKKATSSRTMRSTSRQRESSLWSKIRDTVLEAGLVADLRALNVTPLVAQNPANRRSAIDGRITRHPGYAASQRSASGSRRASAGSRPWAACARPAIVAQRVGRLFTLTAAACKPGRAAQAAGGRLIMPELRPERPGAGPDGGPEHLKTLPRPHSPRPNEEMRPPTTLFPQPASRRARWRSGPRRPRAGAAWCRSRSGSDGSRGRSRRWRGRS